MRNYFIAGIFLLVYSTNLSAQNPLEIKLDKWYTGSLTKVLSDIEESYNIQFSFDRDAGEDIYINSHPSNQTVQKFLDPICKMHRLRYYLGEDNSVYILWRNEQTDEEDIKEIYKDRRTYKGPPEKSNFSLSGRVVDKNSRESLPFVNMIIKGTTIGTYTNVDGYFSLLKVPSDTVTIEISYLGYMTRKIFLSPDMETKDVVYELRPEAQEVGEVTVISANRDVLQTNKQVSMIKLSPVKLGSLPSLGERDIFRSFQLMPGVSAANENSSGLYVRGGTPDQTLVLYDGFTVYNVEHMFGFFSAFNSNAIKDVQLFKGSIDPKYGGRLSSVVNITGKDGNQKNISGAVDVGLLSINGFVEVPIGEKITTIFAARKSWKSSLYEKIFEQYVEENENPMADRFRTTDDNTAKSYFYDLNTKITYRPTDKDNISLSFYNGGDNLDNAINPMGGGGPRGSFTNMSMETTDITKWGNTGSSLKWSRRWTDRLYSNILASYSSYYSERDRSTSGSYTDPDGNLIDINRGMMEDNLLKDFSLKTDFEYKADDHNTVEFGLMATHNDIDYEYSQNDTLKIIDRNSSGNILSLYVQDKLSLFEDRLNISGGMRYNYFSGTSKSYYEPRLNMSYALSDEFKIKASAGKYYQFAKRVVREDIMEGSRDFWALADDNYLPVSSSRQYMLGASYETADFLIDVEAYYKPLYNMTEYSLRIQREGNPRDAEIDYEEQFYSGDGTARGIDFLLQKKLGKYTGWLAYTFGQVIYNFPDFGDYDFYASHDVTHEFKSVNSYKYKRWTFAATWIYASGRPYTAPEGGYQISLLDGTVEDYINVSVKNGYRYPAYHRMDVSASYAWKLGGLHPCQVNFSIFNLYGRRNVWYREYEIIENQIIETDINFLGFTPNISFSINFN